MGLAGGAGGRSGKRRERGRWTGGGGDGERVGGLGGERRSSAVKQNSRVGNRMAGKDSTDLFVVVVGGGGGGGVVVVGVLVVVGVRVGGGGGGGGGGGVGWRWWWWWWWNSKILFLQGL